MCFSATASFGAGAVLGTIGLISIVNARSTPQRLFATIPLIFAAQQITEGVLWLSLKDSRIAHLETIFTYIYLAFAMAIWPLWVPLTVSLLEKEIGRSRIMNLLLGTGIFVSICVVVVLSLYPVQVIAMRHHLHYEFNFPTLPLNLIVPFTVLYLVATIVAPLMSSIKRMKWLGLVFLASYLFAVIFYTGFVVSVWCFFAAALSFIVPWILLQVRKLSP